MKKISVLFFVLCMTFFAVNPGAQASHRITYTPDNEPLYSINFSDIWSISLSGDRIVGISNDGLVWFGTWQIPDVKNFDGAVELLDVRLAQLFTDVVIERADETEFNGMDARLYQGSGKQDGKNIVFLVVIFEPEDGKIGVAAFVGDPIAKEVHKVTVTDMVKSLMPHRG